jgi:hypothetical protein
MTGGEIEKACLRRELRPTRQPGIQQIGTTTETCLEDQRR